MKTIKQIYSVLFLFSLLFFIGCSDDNRDSFIPNPPSEMLEEGIWFGEEAQKAEQSAVIYFAPPKGSPLYEFNADIYVHIGVVSGESWLYVPAEWGENIDKCKMNRIDDNLWSLTLEPSIKEWFGAKTPVFKIGLVFRDAAGQKKGYEEDQFLEVEDNFFKPGKIIHEPQPANTKEGINYHEGGTSVTFVLYDRDKQGKSWEYAYLMGDFTDWGVKSEFQMKRDETTGCWWYTLSNLEPAKEYAFQYFLGKEKDYLFLADAYSEKILDPWNDQYINASTYPKLKSYPKEAVGIVSVFQAKQPTYNWQVNDFKIKDENNLIIYELLLRDFTQSGDINGALEKLPYLKALGINAIELMPTQEFDGNDSWGYNPCFYFAMDKAYGTKNDYKKFIDACHKEGIAVILDVVYNHATGAHPFARLYWDGDKTAPNNPWFNVEAPHPNAFFHDFNHEEPMVRDFIKRNLVFLLEEYKFDGFRFDLSKGFTQKETNSDYESSAKDPTRIAILMDYKNTIKETNPDAIVILEHLCEDKEEIELAKAGMKLWRNYNDAFCQTGMGYSEGSSLTGFYSGDVQKMPFGGYVSYMESHDEERVAYKQTQWGNWDIKANLSNRMKRLGTNAAFCFMVPGPKMLWQFGEMGYDITRGNGDEKTEPKPLHWEYLDIKERTYLHKTYTALLNFRQDYSELFQEDVNFEWKVKEGDWESGRFITLERNGQKLLVIGNFIEKEIEVDNPFNSSGDWYDLMENRVERVYGGDSKIIVPAHEFKAYVNFKIN
ncbi:MAG: alpha-amylase [Bacteroidales bacterium]|nr:alpha-amylase [Bacteroidales bacterium]